MKKISFKNPLTQRIALVGGVLVCAQLLFTAVFSRPSNTDSGRPAESPVPPLSPVTTAPTAEPSPSIAGAGRLTAEMVAALPDDAPRPGFVYDPAGKRDPFRPFDFSPQRSEREDLSPLERYEIGQLKLTAVLDGFDEPTAVVENAAGRGFTVKRGTRIGPNQGVIAEILKDKLVIVETTTDFTGATKSRTIELLIRTKVQKE